MKKFNKIFLLLALTIFPLTSEGQTFNILKTDALVVIKGTSSLHDWEMNLTVINSVFTAKVEGSMVKNIENASFSCKTIDIKSESNLMDSKAYSALKADEFPEIKFNSLSAEGLVSENKMFKGSLKGILNVAGVARDIVIPFNGNFTDSDTLDIRGEVDMKMSTYNISPPKAMLGALKTGDKVTVAFSLRFVQEKSRQNITSK